MRFSHLFFLFFFLPIITHAQLEKVIVETYYIADSMDVKDTTGGRLSLGSVTYRVYVDLKPGSKLKEIYGNVNHPLKIVSDSVFFNHTDRGQSFANQFSLNHFRENNAALDTWLTLGQVTKTGSKTYFGILKVQDTNGNLIAGSNNYDGLLGNTHALIGTPLTTADGLDTMVALPSSWADYGIRKFSGDDSTIFGSLKVGSQFISYNAGLQNSGVKGIDADSNQVLVAQLTTKGKISFELNVVVEEPDGTSTKLVSYVANDSVLLSNEKLNRYLKYPFVQICGCPDPNYLEYKSDRDCDKSDSCKTPIVFGCMDSVACNFNPSANYNIQTLCCFPGYCNDRDISIVCPAISNFVGFTLYPNPAQDQLTLRISVGSNNSVTYKIHNSFGKVVLEKTVNSFSEVLIEQIDVSNLDMGLYLVHVTIGNTTESKIFMKN